MSASQQSSPVSTAPEALAVEPSSSPPASPAAAAGPGIEAASLQGAAGPAPHSTAPGSPSAPSSSGAGGGGSQWAAPHRAASDAGSVDSHVDSHQSWGTHVSHHSQRSRWSIAATVGTTAAPRLAEPRLRDLEEGGSSGEGSRAASPAVSHWRRSETGGSGSAAAAASPRSSGRSPRSRSGRRGSVDACPPSSSSRRLSASEHPLEPAGSSGPVLATGGLQTAESAAAAGKLPPRLIVFNPDGQTFDIAVDKLREDQLAAAAEAAAVERRREQQRAAAAALGPGGARPAGGSRAEQQDPDVAVWRAAYARQKLLVLLSLTADVIYLIVLLILRLGWGADGGGGAPQLGTAAKFFVGSHPDTTSISFIAGTIFTDIIALYGVTQDYPSVVTLFIVWSVVLGAFAILEMPLFFMLLRLLLLVLAFQLRFSMARLHSMLPPASLAHLVATLGSRTASAGRAVWGATTRPFPGGRQRQPAPPTAGDDASPLPGLPPLQRVSGGGLSRSSPTVAAARSSALFRAAVLRMMSEQRTQQAQQGQQGQLDVEQGGGAGSGRGGMQASTEQAGPSGSGAGGSSTGGSRRQRSIARASPAASGSTDALYARILEDIAAVAEAPSSSSGRRRQRRRERDSRRRQATGAASDVSARPSSRAAHSEGSGEEDAAVRAALGRPSTPATRDSGGSSRARPHAAVDRAAAVVQRSTGASGGGAAPTWDDLMALLAIHSLEQAARRQNTRTQAVVPLVSLEAPPPAAAPAAAPEEAGGGSRPG